jgi:hypothetical protein
MKKHFQRCLPPFIALIPTTNEDLAQNLTVLQRQAGLHEQLVEPIQDGLVNDLDAMAYRDSVPVTSRAALYIYLNAMVSTWSMDWRLVWLTM